MGERSRTSRTRSHRNRVAAAATVVVVAGAVAGCQASGPTGAETRPVRNPVSQPFIHPGTARGAAQQFVSALRAGNRDAALRHATATVYDELVRDEAGSTGRARLETCARSGRTWTCSVDFPSTGPADGESYSLTLTRGGSRWTATATAPLAG